MYIYTCTVLYHYSCTVTRSFMLVFCVKNCDLIAKSSFEKKSL